MHYLQSVVCYELGRRSAPQADQRLRYLAEAATIAHEIGAQELLEQIQAEVETGHNESNISNLQNNTSDFSVVSLDSVSAVHPLSIERAARFASSNSCGDRNIGWRRIDTWVDEEGVPLRPSSKSFARDRDGHRSQIITKMLKK